MAKRCIKTVADVGRVARVYRNSDFEEYEVRFSINGEDCGSDSDYFTNDKQDALDTAEHWIKEGN